MTKPLDDEGKERPRRGTHDAHSAAPSDTPQRQRRHPTRNRPHGAKPRGLRISHKTALYLRVIQIGDPHAVCPSACTTFTNQLVSSSPGRTTKLSETS